MSKIFAIFINTIKLKIVQVFFLVFFSIFCFLNQSYAATTTITYVGNSNDIGGGSFNWSNPNNAIGNTTTTAASSTMNVKNVNGNKLSLTNFNLAAASLPVGSKINGISVNVERNVTHRRVRDWTVQLTKDGINTVGTNNANQANGPTVKTTTIYGGIADLWGTTWTDTDLLSSNFGVILEYRYTRNGTQTVNINRVNVVIDYTPNTPPTEIILSNQSIASALPIGSIVGVLSSTDPDIGDSHTYGMNCSVAGVDDASFTIAGSNLKSNAIFDNTIQSVYNICIRTNDGRTGIFDKNFIINILPPAPNNPPTNITLSNQNILEVLSVGSLVGTMSTTDSDISDSHIYSFSCASAGVDDSSFSILGSDLNSNEVFDFSTQSTYNICVRTDDGRGGIFDKNFVISVLVNPNIGYAGVVIDNGGGSFSWSNVNNAEGNTTSTSTTLTINSQNSYSNFLNLTDFKLLGTGLPTNAIISGIQVDVELEASGNGMKDYIVQLTKNGTTAIGNNYGNYVNRSQTKSITTYGGIADLWGSTWTASELLSSNFGVIIQYRNTNGNSRNLDIYRVNITVTYSNPPTNIALTSNIIDEGLTIGSNIGTLSSTDLDIGDTHTYDFICDIPGVDDSSFAISGSNLNSNIIYNYDIKNTYNICIRTDDGNGGTFDKSFVININDINQIPSDITLSNSTITDGLPIGSIVGSLVTTDDDLSDIHNYTFTCSVPGTDDASFGIAIDNLVSNEIFNFSIQSVYNICLRTDDGNGGTFDKNFTININPQIISPGGVGNNLQIWLKGDKGTSTTIHGNALNTWSDQSGNGFDATAGVAPTYFYDTTNHLNFNPIIDFDGTTQYLENLSNGAYSQNYFAVIVPDNNIDGTLSGQVPFGIDCDSGVLSTGTCGLTFAGLTLGAFTVAINDEVITHAIGASTGWRSAQIGTASYDSAKPMLINMNENAAGTGTEISEKGLALDNYNANTYQSLSTADYRLGMSTDLVNTFIYDGKIAEIINYNSRSSLIDKNKIESYLALKYGMTLNSGLQDYISSDGTNKPYDTSIGGVYINDIFGIARDDNSEFSQIKSQSVNSDSVITMEAVGEGSNLIPVFVDMGDREYLTIGNDSGGNTWSAIDAPATYNILSRKWRVQEIGEVGTVNLDFDVGNTNFDIPALAVGVDYYFVYDSDNDNILSDETPIVMINTTGNIWQISGFDLNHTREFTIATLASSNNIPTDIQLSNNIVDENVASGSIIGTFITTDLDILDTHTYSFVSGAGDTDNTFFSINTNILNIGESPDYELQNSYSVRIETDDGNGGKYQEAFIININDIGETLTSVIDFEVPGKYTVTSGTWDRNTVNPNQGSFSVESDNVGANNTQSCFEVTHTFSATGTIDFDYEVSSESSSDFLRFYIDNIEQQSWSGIIPYTSYNKNDISAGTHDYKWCYIKDNAGSAGSDNAYIDDITYQNSALDSTPPVISSINFASGSLLPGGNHNVIINYTDVDSGINIISDIITLNKWDGALWGPDISASGLDLGSKIITATSATFPTNNLFFGKYRYDFQISDNNSNNSFTGGTFYIDTPSLNISTGSLDLGTLSDTGLSFSSDEIIITVKTLGAGFDVKLSKDTSFINSGSAIIIDWDGNEGIGYETSPYSMFNGNINNNPVIATQAESINSNGFEHTYTYNIKIGSLINYEQAAGNYTTNLSLYLYLNY